MFIGLVPPEYLDAVAPQVTPMLEAAVAHSCGECTVEQMLSRVLRGEMHMIVAADDGRVESVVVLSVVEYPNQRTINIAYGAGKHLRRLLPAVKEVARAVGATAIETYTRPEVAALFRRAGFRQAYIVSRLELNNA